MALDRKKEYVKPEYEVAIWIKEGQWGHYCTGAFTINEMTIEHEGKKILLKNMKFPIAGKVETNPENNRPNIKGQKPKPKPEFQNKKETMDAHPGMTTINKPMTAQTADPDFDEGQIPF